MLLKKHRGKHRRDQGRGEEDRRHRGQGHERECRVVERKSESKQHGARYVQRPQRGQDPVRWPEIQDQRHHDQRADDRSHQQQRPDREIAEQRLHHRVLEHEKQHPEQNCGDALWRAAGRCVRRGCDCAQTRFLFTLFRRGAARVMAAISTRFSRFYQTKYIDRPDRTIPMPENRRCISRPPKTELTTSADPLSV